MTRSVRVLFLGFLVGCGSSPGPTAPDGSPDAASPDAAVDARAADGTIDQSPDLPGADAGADAQAITCGPATACNQWLDDAGRCPGSCVAIAGALACHGQVMHGLCFDQAPSGYPDSVTGGPFRLVVRDRPAETTVGATVAISIDLTNTSTAAAEARLGIKPGERFSLIDTGDFDPTRPLLLAAGQTRTVNVHVKAESASVLNPAAWAAVDFTIAGTELEPRGLRVPVPATFAEGSRSCGGRHYPDFNLTPGENYGNAACCEGVFYPGAQCCTSGDCQAGSACTDGICAAGAPNIPYSGSPLGGPQRVLVVFVDEPEPKPPRIAPADPCFDRAAQQGADLGLDQIGAWFADSARRRVGRALTSFRFTVLGGLKTEEIKPANNLPPAYGAAVESWLRARGCTGPWGQDFDRVVIVAPQVNAGAHQGLVYAADRVAIQLWSPSIATHELAHTFGATDRYFDVGGTLQYGGQLMSTVSAPPAELGDGVFWGEAGLGDLDQDGVIDALAFSRAPDQLELGKVTGLANPRNRTLSLKVQVVAREAGRTLVVLPRTIQLDLVDAGISRTLTIDDSRAGVSRLERDLYVTSLSAPRDLPDPFFDALLTNHRTRLRIRIDHRYTDATFQRRPVVMDETRDLEVPLDPGHNPGPLP